MTHKEQMDFFLSIKRKFPERFKNVSVLDVGSLDVNGNNRYLFRNFEYMGVDIRPGNNVDIVCPVHKLPYINVRQFDVVISSEMLEHDIYFEESLKAMLNLLKTEGLLMISQSEGLNTIRMEIYLDLRIIKKNSIKI
jgi:SAM-dependent methyltransferase